MGDQIRNIRRKKHLTRKHLAEHTGVSILRVMLWEINLVRPREDDVKRIAAALGVSLKELTGTRQRTQTTEGGFSPAAYDELPFASKISQDETLLWHGQPDKNRLFTSADAVNIPVSLLFLAFSAYWTYLAVHAGKWFFLLGVPSLLVGLYLLIFRFLYKRYVKGCTYYVITDRRILFCYDGRNTRQFCEVPISELKDVRMTLVGDRGSLYFDVRGSVAVSRAASQRIDNAGMTLGIGEANAFFDIKEPKIPFEILQQKIERTKK